MDTPRHILHLRQVPQPLLVASALGLGHGLVSAYWALGGDWLLDTVGTWAVEFQSAHPVQASLLLSLVAAVKFVAVGLPWLHWCRVGSGGHRWLTALCWAEAILLTTYGLVNTVAAWLVLGDVVHVQSANDGRALLGHAVLWDPWFAAWGLAVVVHLSTSTRRGGLGRARQAKVSSDSPPFEGQCRQLSES